MNKLNPILFLVFLTVAALILPKKTFAHLIGQPPFLVINGKYSDFYHVYSSSITDFPLPQDAAPESYLANSDITFAIDTDKLGVPQDIVKNTTFTWDFTDGQKGTGLKNIHKYKKPGSYILSISADYPGSTGPTIIETIMVNILPNSDYKLPQSKIAVNGKSAKDPIIDIFHFRFGQELKFDGTQSTADSSSIQETLWDFGDGKTDNNLVTKHTYSNDLPQDQVFPLLRVRDENGFIADSYVQITKSDTNDNSDQKQQEPQKKGTVYIKYIFGLLAIISFPIIIYSRITKRKK